MPGRACAAHWGDDRQHPPSIFVVGCQRSDTTLLRLILDPRSRYGLSTTLGLSLPGAPQTVKYPRSACGTQTSLTLRHGLSVGWGDNYQWSLPDQYIDTTGLPDGTYRLWATADQANRFQESNDANNATRADLQIDASGVTVLHRHQSLTFIHCTDRDKRGLVASRRRCRA